MNPLGSRSYRKVLRLMLFNYEFIVMITRYIVLNKSSQSSTMMIIVCGKLWGLGTYKISCPRVICFGKKSHGGSSAATEGSSTWFFLCCNTTTAVDIRWSDDLTEDWKGVEIWESKMVGVWRWIVAAVPFELDKRLCHWSRIIISWSTRDELEIIKSSGSRIYWTFWEKWFLEGSWNG